MNELLIYPTFTTVFICYLKARDWEIRLFSRFILVDCRLCIWGDFFQYFGTVNIFRIITYMVRSWSKGLIWCWSKGFVVVH